MKKVQFGSRAGLPTRDEEHLRDVQEPSTYPTPAEVMVQIGCVIAFCLGLALLADVLVPMLGTQ